MTYLDELRQEARRLVISLGSYGPHPVTQVSALGLLKQFRREFEAMNAPKSTPAGDMTLVLWLGEKPKPKPLGVALGPPGKAGQILTADASGYLSFVDP